MDLLNLILQKIGLQQPAPLPKPRMTMDQAMAELAKSGWKDVTPTGQPIKAQQLIPADNPQPTQAPFQFINDQADYSYMKPKLEAMYQHYGNPPMSQFTDQFIESGQKYGVDPRVVPFISHIESSSGKSYPEDSFNPFGYIWLDKNGDGVSEPPKTYEDIVAGLRGAGFSSVPQAIDLLTKRFSTQYNNGKSAYPNFTANPTLDNLQQSYNANSGERNGYMTLLEELSNLAR